MTTGVIFGAGPELVFSTCSRADWAKLRPLVRACAGFDVGVGVYGQHLSWEQGYTAKEVLADCSEMGVLTHGPSRPRMHTMTMAEQFSEVAQGSIGAFRHVVVHGDRHEALAVRHVVVHGDRHEALAVATQAVIGGARLIHVEAGERSGNLDDRFRDAITAMADLAFCAQPMHQEEVTKRFRARAYTIGSPEYDEIISNNTRLQDVRERYGLDVSPREYEVFLVHPETGRDADNTRLCAALRAELGLAEGRGHKVVAIAPNLDDGREAVLETYGDRRVIPSMRASHFYALLKHCFRFVSNSSAAVRMQPGCEVVVLGNRQHGRVTPGRRWGDGKAGERFVRALKEEGVL